MDSLINFNPSPSFIMHIDLNSCFATIEQQANPLLRGRPIAVAAFTSPGGCILAASVEAKKLGIKTGMRVRDGKQIFPKLVVLSPDPWKYRNIHLKLRNLISDYTNDFVPKSIDEFVLNLKDYMHTYKTVSCMYIAREIKRRIRNEIGEWLTFSVGIAPNRYLAKIAAGLHKPDGLDEINKTNYLDIYSKLKLADLTGIKERSAFRLNSVGIYSVLDFYKAPIWKLKAAFHSINGLYWHTRLSGFEIDDFEFKRSSFGNSVALGQNISTTAGLSPILARLTEKMCSRLRHSGYTAGGVHLALVYKDGSFWHKGRLTGQNMFDTQDIYKVALRLFLDCQIEKQGSEPTPVLNIAVSCFNLHRFGTLQLQFFKDVSKKQKLVQAVDIINERWGDFTIFSGRGMDRDKIVMDRIAFGGIKELEEFTLLN